MGQEHGNDNVPLHGAWYIHIWTILVAAGKHHFPICLVGSGCQLLQTPWITILVKANPWLSRLSGSALAIGIAKYGSDNPSAFPNMEVTTTANRGCLWLSVGSRVGKFCTPQTLETTLRYSPVQYVVIGLCTNCRICKVGVVGNEL